MRGSGSPMPIASRWCSTCTLSMRTPMLQDGQEEQEEQEVPEGQEDRGFWLYSLRHENPWKVVHSRYGVETTQTRVCTTRISTCQAHLARLLTRSMAPQASGPSLPGLLIRAAQPRHASGSKLWREPSTKDSSHCVLGTAVAPPGASPTPRRIGAAPTLPTRLDPVCERYVGTYLTIYTHLDMFLEKSRSIPGVAACRLAATWDIRSPDYEPNAKDSDILSMPRVRCKMYLHNEHMYRYVLDKIP
ncbi:hypothetical protein VTK73DRAFT_3046 [Phialemonium thermophilum]|uniref:Uncharacterized protein n=1 Tax=Phialemonium thermophilum TaxID=223376 RepID=A0ABR3VLW1_9PEZI